MILYPESCDNIPYIPPPYLNFYYKGTNCNKKVKQMVKKHDASIFTFRVKDCSCGKKKEKPHLKLIKMWKKWAKYKGEYYYFLMNNCNNLPNIKQKLEKKFKQTEKEKKKWTLFVLYLGKAYIIDRVYQICVLVLYTFF